jgi:hypothetical protein
MTRWTPCGEAFIVGDVVRWTEPVWEERRRKWVKVGERGNTAQVQEISGEWAVFVVKESSEFKPGEVIRRRRDKVGRGNAHRLAWSDESARSLVASEHFKPEPAAPSARHAAKREPVAARGRGDGRASGRRGYLRRGKRKRELKP